jgi:hypothetical protein
VRQLIVYISPIKRISNGQDNSPVIANVDNAPVNDLTQSISFDFHCTFQKINNCSPKIFLLIAKLYIEVLRPRVQVVGF